MINFILMQNNISLGIKMKKFNYIDLYSGIGGFKYALDSIDGNCVFSAEINSAAKRTYVYNHKVNYNEFGNMDDYKEVDYKIINKLPEFKGKKIDVITAGFPCQTFSVAGNRKGFNSGDARGTQFFNVLNLTKGLRPKFLVLENVKHLVSHDDGITFRVIIDSLKEIGYDVVFNKVLSPLDIGIPQNRERIFIIVKDRKFKYDLQIHDFKKAVKNNYLKLEELGIIKYGSSDEGIKITRDENNAIKAWEKFIKLWLKNRDSNEKTIPSLWLEEMLDKRKPDFSGMPDWKIDMIQKMRTFYKKHKKWIDKWFIENDSKMNKRIQRKLEWNAGINFEPRETIVVIRQSGVRFKKPNFFPTLVAVVDIPIIYDNILGKWRNISANEMCKLQSYDYENLRKPNDVTYKDFYKQLGNSVNVELVKMVVKQFEGAFNR